ncbi:MAG: serpin family protein, partial [Actinomycetota bacterium]|nr:serpin family protein [Actinomycetota bacterium]
SEVSEIDFSSPDAPDRINSWIEEKTKGKIDKMIDSIPPDAVMYLINAIYFKGDWTYPFDENLTGEDDFYLEDGTTKKIPMMKQEKEFYYYAEDSFSAIKLPYGKEKMSMYIILPDKETGIDTLLESLSVDKWNSIKDSFSSREVSLTMPEYKMEYGIKSLKDALTTLGMGIAFDREQADFSGIYKSGETPCWISDVLHKAVIEVNEKGSEAAAAAVEEMALSAMPDEEIIEFTVDRPFFFMIIDERTGSILFMGKVMEPEVVEP